MGDEAGGYQGYLRGGGDEEVVGGGVSGGLDCNGGQGVYLTLHPMCTLISGLSFMQDNFPPKPLLLALLSLATPTHPAKETLALKSLLIAHHPSIGQFLSTVT